MLQETNAGGVRACHLVPSFGPYIESLPHPKLEDGGGGNVIVTVADGVMGTLPPSVKNHTDYTGSELEHGVNLSWDKAPNVKSRVPLPGENAQPSQAAGGILGWQNANLWSMKFGKNYGAGGGSHAGTWQYHSNAEGRKNSGRNGWANPGWKLEMDADSLQFYLTKERCMDSEIYTLHRQDVGGTPHIFYEDTSGERIDTGWTI